MLNLRALLVAGIAVAAAMSGGTATASPVLPAQEAAVSAASHLDMEERDFVGYSVIGYDEALEKALAKMASYDSRCVETNREYKPILMGPKSVTITAMCPVHYPDEE
ncbi:hypothetical protein [Streptomyces sp. NPDC001774]